MRQARQYRRRARAAIVVAFGASALVLAGPAGADTKASIACRGAIAKGASLIAKTGFKLNDTCHKTQDKALLATGDCNDVAKPAFDPTGKYAKVQSKSWALVTAKCAAGDPVLANYDAQDPQATVGAVVDESVSGNSALVVGNTALGGDKTKIKCVETIGKLRTGIVNEIVKNSIKCQATKDKTATSFGALDPSCVDAGAKSTAKATAGIPVACGSLTGADVGTCDPLPSCVVDAAAVSAQGVAKAVYKKVTVATCGDGVVQAPEQCDDGANNGTPGDPCNAKCESLLETCGPGTAAGGTITGHRIVTVSLSVPAGKQLAGVRLGFDYPQLEASIPGTGISSVVQPAFQVLQASPASGFLSLANDTDTEAQFILSSGENWIDAGPLLQVTLDQCVGLSHNICNRNQQVIDCAPTADIPACNADPEDQVACFAGAAGVVNRTDCVTAACTDGVCAGFPLAASGTCQLDSASSAFLCTTTGRACTAATETTDCATWAAPVGSCNTSSKTCTSTSPNPGKACTAASEAVACSGSHVDEATCTASHECSRLGDQTNGFYGCASIFNPLGAAIGQFPSPGPVGPATASHFGFPLPGACPTGNTCVDQAQLTAASCTVTQPTDALGQNVDGVTCSITVTEAP